VGCLDRDGVGYGTDLHHGPDAGTVIGEDLDVALLELLEARHFNRDVIGGGRQRRQQKQSFPVGLSRDFSFVFPGTADYTPTTIQSSRRVAFFAGEATFPQPAMRLYTDWRNRSVRGSWVFLQRR
jgi:hypothetical protein